MWSESLSFDVTPVPADRGCSIAIRLTQCDLVRSGQCNDVRNTFQKRSRRGKLGVDQSGGAWIHQKTQQIVVVDALAYNLQRTPRRRLPTWTAIPGWYL